MAIVTTTAPIHDPPVEACLAQLLDHFGIPGAHFAGRSLADVQDFIAKYPERIASLTLVCPTVLNPRSLVPLGTKLMVVTGDHGLGARRVQAVLPDLPEATAVVLNDYAGLTWATIREFHQRSDACPAAGLREQQGEIAGISFRIRGSGPPSGPLRRIEGILDGLAGVKPHCFAGWDFDSLPASRIPSLPCSPCRDIESAQPRDTHRLSAYEGIENGGYNRLHRLTRQPVV